MDTLKIMTGVFRRIFDDEPLQLLDETTAQDIPGWDSLTHINLIIEIEEEFGLRFNIDDIADLKNVGEMVEMVERKLIAKEKND
jgi:acyl carrier protein